MGPWYRFRYGSRLVRNLFFRRHPAGTEKPPVLPASGQPAAKTVEDVTRRLLELEERVDATEYLMKRDKIAQPRKPPRAGE